MYFPNYQDFNPVSIFIFMRSVHGICLVSLNEYVRNKESPIFGTFIKLFSRTGNFMPPNTTGKTKGLTTFCTFIKLSFSMSTFKFSKSMKNPRRLYYISYSLWVFSQFGSFHVIEENWENQILCQHYSPSQTLPWGYFLTKNRRF